MSDKGKSRAQTQFGAAADEYASSEIHAHGDSLRVLLELTRARPDWTVVDVASGAGHTALTFSPLVARVIATDVTEAMARKTAELARARGFRNIRVSLADAEQMPLAGQTTDMVTCRLAFHHFTRPTKAIVEFRRVLKPGGIVGFTDNVTVEDSAAAEYYNAYERLRDPSHHCVYSTAQLRYMFTAAGFRVEAEHILTRELEFEEWADRQRVSQADKDTLIEMMRDLPGSLQSLFAPRWANNTMYFSLWETVFLARRQPRRLAAVQVRGL